MKTPSPAEVGGYLAKFWGKHFIAFSSSTWVQSSESRGCEVLTLELSKKSKMAAKMAARSRKIRLLAISWQLMMLE